MPLPRFASAVFVCALALAGCAGPLSGAESEFDQGHYPQAKQDLAALEAQSRLWTDAARAEYALYRGLTYGALGDRARAIVWLGQARAIELARPGSLTADLERRLRAGLVGCQLAPAPEGQAEP